MPLLLHIDTSGEKGFVAIADSNQCLAAAENDKPMEHASFVQPAIAELCRQLNISLANIDAICVSNGPGSYTGLRVGLASAKGLCYALQKPLIALSTLHIMAHAMLSSPLYKPGMLVAPLTDARRMEVFFALYDQNLQVIIEPGTAILDDRFLAEYTPATGILFAGSGAAKLATVSNNANHLFTALPSTIASMCTLGYKYFEQQDFASLAYAKPFYCKAFYSTQQPAG
jgi:tRNA threonylcarbamoyladenosine biosynthesis protein TsaB